MTGRVHIYRASGLLRGRTATKKARLQGRTTGQDVRAGLRGRNKAGLQGEGKTQGRTTGQDVRANAGQDYRAKTRQEGEGRHRPVLQA